MRRQIPVVSDTTRPLSPIAFTLTSDTSSIIKNACIELHKDAIDNSQKIFFVKRPGLNTPESSFPNPGGTGRFCSAAAAAPGGSGNRFFIFSDGTLANTVCYLNTTAKALPGTWTGVGSSFDLIQLSSALGGVYSTYEWAFTNFTEGAVVAADGTITEITDAEYVAWTTKSNMVAMDGYIFQADPFSNYIYNSDLNAPTSWTATGRIAATLHPGMIIALKRLKNYLVCFKNKSIEFFTNEGRPTPGSPLAPQPHLVRRYGAMNCAWIADVTDGLIFAGYTPAGKAGVFKLSARDLSITEISNSFIAQLLQQNVNYGSTEFVSSYASASQQMAVLPYKNKELVLFPININSGGSTATFVFDAETGLWYMWTSSVTGSEGAFPSNNLMVIKDSPNGTTKILVSGVSNTNFYEVDDLVYRDYGSVEIDVKWVSDRYDFGSTRRKFMSSLEVQYDIVQAQATSTITFYYYDDDTAVPSSADRTITLGTSGTTRAIWRRLGSFRSRRFVIKHSGNSPFRMSVVEVDIDAGEDTVD